MVILAQNLQGYFTGGILVRKASLLLQWVDRSSRQ